MGRRYEAERKGVCGRKQRSTTLALLPPYFTGKLRKPKSARAPLPCESTISKCEMSEKERQAACEKCSIASIRIFVFFWVFF